ncbi:SAM-dependent methyltransferase [Eikenella sp. NML96-A-049]|uniref:SAM-dependent methyltransferase n=1 Tax=Eikenella sp. NML96-A-049 TaxID=1809061 RepID=UPI001E5D5247|nr:SAM-dependent methyltransferase [Eikenella sp. NML96-A-049]
MDYGFDAAQYYHPTQRSGGTLIGHYRHHAVHNPFEHIGLTDLLAAQGEPESQAYIRAAAACQTLLAPQEMGELFKAIAFGRNIDPDWQGFAIGDLCHKL